MERKKQTRKTRGRQKAITPEVVEKLITAFKMGLSVREAAAFVNVSKTAIYDYLAKNPEFKDNVKTLQFTPSMLAKVAIYGAIAAGDIDTCKWLLERDTKRFSERERARLIRVQRKEIERSSNPELLQSGIEDFNNHWAKVNAYFTGNLVIDKDKPEETKE